jgi:hypothetical protein
VTLVTPVTLVTFFVTLVTLTTSELASSVRINPLIVILLGRS